MSSGTRPRTGMKMPFPRSSRTRGVDGALVILTPPEHDQCHRHGRGHCPYRPAVPQTHPVLLHGHHRRVRRRQVSSGKGCSRVSLPRECSQDFRRSLPLFPAGSTASNWRPFPVKNDKQRAAEIIAEAMDRGNTYIGEIGGTELLACYGFKRAAHGAGHQRG